MKAITRHFLVGIICVVPNVGCVTTLSSAFTDTPSMTTTDKKEARLPSKESLDIVMGLAADLERDGFTADAIVQLEKARAMNPKLNLSRRLAVMYDKIGEERKAMVEFEIALKKAPKDADLLNDFGYCHYNRGRWADAEKNFRLALAQNSQHARANINLGLTLAQQDKPDEAMEAFLKVNRPAEAKANLAFVAAAKGKKQLATQLYQEALRDEPGLQTARQGMMALEKGPPQPKPPVQQTKATVKKPCANGKCPAPEPDMSPITIDRPAR